MRSRITCVCILFSLLALAGCSGNANIPPTASPSPVTTPTPAAPPPLSVYFSMLTPVASQSSTPVAATESSVSALSAGTGTLRWTFTAAAQVQNVPVVERGTLFVGADDQKVYALNIGDGSVRWKSSVDGQPHVITVQDGVVYGDIDQDTGGHFTRGPIFALDASTGALKWLSAVSGSFYGLVDGVVYAATTDNQLYALDAARGSARWHFQMKAQFDGLKVADGQVYLLAAQRASGNPNVALSVLNASTGALQWSYPTSPKDLENLSLVGVENGVVYLTSSEQQKLAALPLALALNASDGSLLWQYHVHGPATSFTESALDADRVYLGTDTGALVALGAQKGAREWQTNIAQTALNIDLMDHGVMYITVSGQGVTALKLSSGSILWRYNSAGYVSISSARNGVLYGFSLSGSFPATSQNYILALRASNGSLLWRFNAGASSIFPVLS
jgi:outer membrane protein assembly factor BamB